MIDYDQLIFFLLRLPHYAKKKHYNETTGGRIIIIIGKPLLFLSVKNAAVMFKNNRIMSEM